ncbi:hypothetical protein B0H13DRAFT_1897169 [Mycena leptocephala]|nr:hypothetical protein B0H13DRAFT_1897169 [Mycena leptocephala]
MYAPRANGRHWNNSEKTSSSEKVAIGELRTRYIKNHKALRTSEIRIRGRDRQKGQDRSETSAVRGTRPGAALRTTAHPYSVPSGPVDRTRGCQRLGVSAVILLGAEVEPATGADADRADAEDEGANEVKERLLLILQGRGDTLHDDTCLPECCGRRSKTCTGPPAPSLSDSPQPNHWSSVRFSPGPPLDPTHAGQVLEICTRKEHKQKKQSSLYYALWARLLGELQQFVALLHQDLADAHDFGSLGENTRNAGILALFHLIPLPVFLASGYLPPPSTLSELPGSVFSGSRDNLRVSICLSSSATLSVTLNADATTSVDVLIVTDTGSAQCVAAKKQVLSEQRPRVDSNHRMPHNPGNLIRAAGGTELRAPLAYRRAGKPVNDLDTVIKQDLISCTGVKKHSDDRLGDPSISRGFR